jgi:hypothetical protein
MRRNRKSISGEGVCVKILDRRGALPKHAMHKVRVCVKLLGSGIMPKKSPQNHSKGHAFTLETCVTQKRDAHPKVPGRVQSRLTRPPCHFETRFLRREISFSRQERLLAPLEVTTC